ncbi:PHA/PHB synthase family protein [Simplicispira metamorpha]|uniref:Polyhydroxyalkanoate synthase n=1 Tax=Simplicispira metamorpha TaxID=80881 RepID=A0A4R2NGX1_9BURK|nr:alpha/beta fold hydrolase [Simplicispira metamorpha]TCP20364.1 polyhydroxyalkanoate synthase [Simplicispira metamorpha]
MEKPTKSSVPFERQREATQALDETFHGFLTRSTMGLSPIALALAAADWAMHLAASPGRQMVLGQRALALAQQAMATAVNPPMDENGQPIADNDNRFIDASWRQWPFSALKEGYKANSAWWREAVQVDGMSRHHSHMVEFFNRQIMDTFTPSNWLLTNPEALNKAQETQGQSLLQGYQHFSEDLRKAETARSTPDVLEPLTFEVGKDVAITPGKVVYRNHLIELIQYTPTTDKVYPEPLLIVPSCIMKYYILDLSQSNSMVKYLVGQGYTVFIISWRNPDASDRDLGMQDYLQMGVMDALAAVKERAGAPRVHALGYCLGGTFLSIVAAAMGRHTRMAQNQTAGRRAEDRSMERLPELASVTLLAAQTDFSEPGEMGVFIDDEQLKTLRQQMDLKGYLSGSAMAGSFQFLNMRELVFTRNTRRYLLGQEEADFDLMSWNSDLTRLPARMHSEYLSSLFLNNALATGKYRVAGQGIALMDIHAPMLVVGTTRDHVSPWRSVYKIHLQTDTHVTFVLAAGGHNAGIVSEPGRPRRSYQINSIEDNQGWVEPDEWLASAPTRQGSWWEAMDAWLKERSGKPVAPPAIDPAHVLCDAPGEYVMVRYAD